MDGSFQPRTDETHVQAVIDLAQKFFEYGQFPRVLVLLDLVDWLAATNEQAVTLRIRTLCKTGRFDKAVSICLDDHVRISSALLAEVYWGLGELYMGDDGFRAAIAQNDIAAPTD